MTGGGPASGGLSHAFSNLRLLPSLRTGSTPDYVLGEQLGVGHIGLSKDNIPALLVPLSAPPGGVARSAAGCVLKPEESVAFEVHGQRWTQPAAVLECTDPNLLDTFAVLASDVAWRSARPGSVPAWSDVASVVDEWQALLAKSRCLAPEQELGLWGEIRFILDAAEPPRLLRAWTGPDGAPWDFVLGGIAAEVKASRSRLRHLVSQEQVDRPRGDHEAYLVSLWIGEDSALGRNLPNLVDELLERAGDAPWALRRAMEAGYFPSERSAYTRCFLLLERPKWFAACSVPRVRTADPGVSQLRYGIRLDEDSGLQAEEEARLVRHFHHTATP